MSLPGIIKNWINRGFKPFNMRLDSLTAERAEVARLLTLKETGHFNQPVFPLLPQFARCNPMALLDAVASFNNSTKRFCYPGTDNGYSFSNNYFTSPDAEVAYAMVRTFKPKCLIEVGSGNSTQLFREAIEDGELGTEIVSIDPSPRKAIKKFAHRIISQHLEHLPVSYFCEALECNDILFIDSSHQVRIGNDVINLILNIIPTLKKDVLIHFHDIFLPYDYPLQWMINYRWDWNEQYFVQALLQGSDQFEVLWPGQFLQRTLPNFPTYFDFKPQGMASSLWLRKIV
jgi:hypothetical protein